MLAQQPGVDRHVIDPLPGLLLDDAQEILRPHVEDVVELLGHLVKGNRANWHRRRLDDAAAHRVDLLAGREIHHRIGSKPHGRQEFLDLAGGVARNGRLADVRVDLGSRRNANADGGKILCQMDLIGRNHHPTAGDLVTNEGRLELFGTGDRLDFGRHLACPGELDLGHGLAPQPAAPQQRHLVGTSFSAVMQYRRMPANGQTP